MSDPTTPGGAAPARASGARGQTAAVAALQAALAAEYAAVFGYAVAGARLTGPKRTLARRDWVIHEKARDTLITMVAARDATPVPAAADYRLPFPVHDATAAVALAVHLEDGVTTAYLGLVALPQSHLRAFGARAVQAAALRAAAWRGHTVAFPGLPAPGRPHAAGRGTPPPPG